MIAEHGALHFLHVIFWPLLAPTDHEKPRRFSVRLALRHCLRILHNHWR
jgi:hypothetical protein